MKKVAVTGGLACGKTSVCHFFEELGAFVFSADAIVHHLLLTDLSLQENIVSLLGPEVRVGGVIDRTEVAQRVFADPEKLARMEQMIHPLVHQELQRQYEIAEKSGKYSLFIAEVPLLFEVNGEGDFDITVAVSAQKARERYTGQDYDARISRQLLTTDKAARADIQIRNDGTLADLKRETEQVFKRLTQ